MRSPASQRSLGTPERTRAAGAEVVMAPTDMPYGVREYVVRDAEGGLWSFMQPRGPA